MITEPGLSNDVGRYDDDTDLDLDEDELKICPDPRLWVTPYKADDTDLDFEEREEASAQSSVTYSRDPAHDTLNVFEVASYQVANKCHISLIADGPVDRQTVQNLIEQLTIDLDSGLFDSNPRN